MNALRTPDERFENLPDFDFVPNYLEIGDLRMHYLDEGPRDGEIVLLLHGEPTWSFLYRHMIPVLARHGLRAIAPDLIGFGRSDKPMRVSDYTFDAHIGWIDQFITRLNLTGITLFGQDWGSLIGLRYAAENQDRFARIVIANGFLPFGEGKVPPAFRIWRQFARWTPKFPTSRIVQSATVRVLSSEERAAYDGPFPKEKFKAGARAFPRLVPVEPDNPAVPACRAAWNALGTWQKPFLTLFGSRDPIFRGLDKTLHEHIPGTSGQPHQVLSKAGHFIQEDRGPELAEATAAFVALTSALPA